MVAKLKQFEKVMSIRLTFATVFPLIQAVELLGFTKQSRIVIMHNINYLL